MNVSPSVATSIDVTASSARVVYGQSVNLTATVLSTITPNEGTVTFRGGAALLGTAAVTSGTASLNNLVLPLGSQLITASYADSRGAYAASASTVGPNSVIATVAGNGTYSYSGDGGPATAAQLYLPNDCVLDSAGDMFIADTANNRIREVNALTGVITTVAGNGTAGYAGDNGPASAAELDNPAGIAVDSLGDLFIADVSNNRIREVNHATGVITTIAGNGTSGISGDNGPAIAAALDKAGGVVLDAAGNVFIADTGNYRIRELNRATGTITTVAGNGNQGSSGNNGPATAAEFFNPLGLAMDSAGDLFIAEEYSSTVREVNHATDLITAVAGNGTQGFSGDHGQATAAELTYLTVSLSILRATCSLRTKPTSESAR